MIILLNIVLLYNWLQNVKITVDINKLTKKRVIQINTTTLILFRVNLSEQSTR